MPFAIAISALNHTPTFPLEVSFDSVALLEAIRAGQEPRITLVVTEILAGRVRLGMAAPKYVQFTRGELEPVRKGEQDGQNNSRSQVPQRQNAEPAGSKSVST